MRVWPHRDPVHLTSKPFQMISKLPASHWLLQAVNTLFERLVHIAAWLCEATLLQHTPLHNAVQDSAASCCLIVCIKPDEVHTS